jgi:formiminoglutamase
MKDISIYFQTIEKPLDFNQQDCLGNIINANNNNFPDLNPGDIALIFVPEFRNMNASFHFENFSAGIREELYKLYPKRSWIRNIVDLGEILPGNSTNDTFYALSAVTEELIKADIFPIIVGGSQDLTLAQFDAYKDLEQLVNLVSIDSSPDFGLPEEDLMPYNYLQHVLKRSPNHLFNYSTIGTQLYLVNPTEIDLMEKLFFDVCRLGDFNKDYTIAEPLIRNADLATIDLLAIRNSDYPRDEFSAPNGFYAEQICQIARYCGFSDKMSSIGLYNVWNPENDSCKNQLVSQIIWHIIDGINSRVGDFPKGNKKDYKKYRVALSQFKDEIVFYKSQKSDRWWIEVPYHPSEKSKYERHYMVPCNYDDYKTALEDEVPDLWWKTYQKIFA